MSTPTENKKIPLPTGMTQEQFRDTFSNFQRAHLWSLAWRKWKRTHPEQATQLKDLRARHKKAVKELKKAQTKRAWAFSAWLSLHTQLREQAWEEAKRPQSAQQVREELANA